MPPQKSELHAKKASNITKPKIAASAKSGCITCRIRRKVRNITLILNLVNPLAYRNVTINLWEMKALVRPATGSSLNV